MLRGVKRAALAEESTRPVPGCDLIHRIEDTAAFGHRGSSFAPEHVSIPRSATKQFDMGGIVRFEGGAQSGSRFNGATGIDNRVPQSRFSHGGRIHY
jgi:hypothetical protein